MNNLFSYSVENEFVQSKETIVNVNYCGRKVAEAYEYLGDIQLHFTETQPGIPMGEWHFLETVLRKIKERGIFKVINQQLTQK